MTLAAGRSSSEKATARLTSRNRRPPVADAGAEFQDAAVDGSRVFFTATAGLTEDSNSSGTDLYAYDLASGQLADLSLAPDRSAADVFGVLGSSADGSRVYFAARGHLDPGDGPTRAENDAEGVYSVFSASAGRVEYCRQGDRRGPRDRRWPAERHGSFRCQSDLAGDPGRSPPALRVERQPDRLRKWRHSRGVSVLGRLGRRTRLDRLRLLPPGRQALAGLADRSAAAQRRRTEHAAAAAGLADGIGPDGVLRVARLPGCGRGRRPSEPLRVGGRAGVPADNAGSGGAGLVHGVRRADSLRWGDTRRQRRLLRDADRPQLGRQRRAQRCI